MTDSPDYILWEAEKGQTTVNNEYIGVNPYVGTLYRSQNSMEYIPFMNEDLMFRLNRCVFSTTSSSMILQSEEQSEIHNADKVRLIETSVVPTGTAISYSLKANTISGSMESNYRSISPGQIISFENDTNYAAGFRRKIANYKGDFTVKVDLTTTNDAVSPVVSVEKAQLNIWENFVDNAEINSDDFAIVAAGTGYGNSNVIVISSSSGTGATANLSCDASGNILSVFVSSTGSGYIDDYTITIGANTNYPSVAASGTGGNVVLNTEYDSSGGPCLARYITRQITLADGFDAGDLRVFVSANKPTGTEIDVFCKLLSASDATPFKDRRYQKLVCVNPTTTPSLTPVDFRDYEYRPSATDNFVTYTSSSGVTYNTFKNFAIKIVMRSEDPTVVPKAKDLRIIALPAE
jgi:NADPH-dependent curcumin reductase CurA